MSAGRGRFGSSAVSCFPPYLPVRVTAQYVTVLADDEVPKVKVWYGRLGRFIPASQVPPFEHDAWLCARKVKGRWEFKGCACRAKSVPSVKPAPNCDADLG